MDCDQTAMSIPPVTSAVFLAAVILAKRRWLGGISEMPLPLGIKLEWYVMFLCMYVISRYFELQLGI
jgi:hypothetical protein